MNNLSEFISIHQTVYLNNILALRQIKEILFGVFYTLSVTTKYTYFGKKRKLNHSFSRHYANYGCYLGSFTKECH